MSDNTRCYDMAALAEASYVYFDKLNKNYTDGKVADALQNSKFEGKFSATQAVDFVSHWQVVSHEPNTSNGFSATLFNLSHDSTEIYSDERCLGLGVNPGSVTVVGHSLGGHLAAAFSRLFPGVADNYESAFERRLPA